jgi:pSer/pThr/pTyr-binding forkhead associated (FHA) protein
VSDLILEIIEGPAAGQQLPLTQALEAGRSAEATLTLTDEQASRHHARFEPGSGGAVVTDLGSSNGTYVNDQPISGARQLRPGDRVRIGLSVIELRDRAAVAAQPSAVTQLPPFAAPGAEGLGVAAASNTAPVGDDYAALAALVDTNVKRQTGVATFALLAAAGLAVLIYFGVT